MAAVIGNKLLARLAPGSWPRWIWLASGVVVESSPIAMDLDRFAVPFVAMTPMVVCSGAAKRSSAPPAASACAVSISRRPSGASRVPATSAPVSGSRTSPSALTATSAPTTTSPRRTDALPIPPRIARATPWSLPTLAPVPAPTLPSATGPATAAAAAA